MFVKCRPRDIHRLCEVFACDGPRPVEVAAEIGPLQDSQLAVSQIILESGDEFLARLAGAVALLERAHVSPRVALLECSIIERTFADRGISSESVPRPSSQSIAVTRTPRSESQETMSVPPDSSIRHSASSSCLTTTRQLISASESAASVIVSAVAPVAVNNVAVVSSLSVVSALDGG